MTSSDPRTGTPGDTPGRDGIDEVTIYGQVPPVHDQRWAAWRLSEFQRRRRRRRRQTFIFFAALVLTLCLGGYASAVALGAAQWPWTPAPPVIACPTGSVTPLAPAKVTVNVLNATDRQGLATRISTQLQAESRGFSLGSVGNDTSDGTVSGTAQIRTGTRGIPAAKAVQTQVARSVIVLDRRDDDSVDLVLGTDFTKLRPAAAASKLLVAGPVTKCQVADTANSSD